MKKLKFKNRNSIIESLVSWISIYLITLVLGLTICIIALSVDNIIFLEKFLKNNMSIIQITLLAINIPSLCILMNNIVELIKKKRIDNIAIKSIDLPKYLKFSLFEQIAYFLIGFISLIIYFSLCNSSYKFSFLIFVFSWLFMSIATTIDCFLTIIAIYELSFNFET
jgi:hypothetical protein